MVLLDSDFMERLETEKELDEVDQAVDKMSKMKFNSDNIDARKLLNNLK